MVLVVKVVLSLMLMLGGGMEGRQERNSIMLCSLARRTTLIRMESKKERPYTRSRSKQNLSWTQGVDLKSIGAQASDQ
jgi:hypothetical protein